MTKDDAMQSLAEMDDALEASGAYEHYAAEAERISRGAPLEMWDTVSLIARLREIVEEAGTAWGEGFVDSEVAGILHVLESRGTKMATDALREIAPFWYES